MLTKRQLSELLELVDTMMYNLTEEGSKGVSSIEKKLNIIFSGDIYDPNAYNDFKEEIEEVEVLFVPQATLPLSNFGGISIMTDPENDNWIYYKWYNDKPVRAELCWRWRDIELEDTVEDNDVLSFFIDGEPYNLDEFVRVDF